MKHVRLWTKRLIQRLHLASIIGLIEYCKDCGEKQPLVWHAPDGLWAEVRDRPLDQDGGVLCPKCFDRRAEAKGMLLMWRPEVEAR